MSATAAVVMPHYTRDPSTTDAHLEAALQGLAAQTDDDWHLFLVDNASEMPDAREYLRERTRHLGDRVTIAVMPDNRGAGHARNAAIALAAAAGCPTISYNDADDISPPERIATVRETFERPEVNVTFGAWQAIDGAGEPIPAHLQVPHLQRIRGELDSMPTELHDPFLLMATEVGYFMLTSATSVRTEIARAHPWPSAYSAEDLHTWYRYCAHGGTFVYHPALQIGYRVTDDNAGSPSADRYGGQESWWDNLDRLEIDGFTRGLDIAVVRGQVAPEDRHAVAAAFHDRTAEVWRLCEQPELRAKSLDLAAEHRRLLSLAPAAAPASA